MDKDEILFSEEKPNPRSGFARPRVAETLPKQTLLLDKDRLK
jgi:hypothetical protein